MTYVRGVAARRSRSANGKFCHNLPFQAESANDVLWSKAVERGSVRNDSFPFSIAWNPSVRNRPSFGHSADQKNFGRPWKTRLTADEAGEIYRRRSMTDPAAMGSAERL